ncbi:MAG TPA: aminomethyl transferase family protein [Pseudolysinimonas sp.]|nr:aminomethyl transferase family protein [Pseudolysinimonas sp.]
MSASLAQAIRDAGGAIPLLKNNRVAIPGIPQVPAEYSNWRDEQLSWRNAASLFDQSHHMVDYNVKGPDALKVLTKLGINSFENFPVDVAKQFVSVGYDGYVIGDEILFHLDDDEYQLVGQPAVIDWVQYNIERGDYDVTTWRDDNSLIRQGDPVLYRYQIQGPRAVDVIRTAIGSEPEKLKFFHMTHFTIGGKDVRALRHGMVGQPGYELWGPWEDNEAVLAALLEAGEEFGLERVGRVAYLTTAVESGWHALPLPAVYEDERLADYREWTKGRSFLGSLTVGGSFTTEDVRDYYFTPYDLGYGRIISYDHDFIGRDVLEKWEAEGRHEKRLKVTLVWNEDDVKAAQGSWFEEGMPAKFMGMPAGGYAAAQYDQVLIGDELVGVSTSPSYFAVERTFLSRAYLTTAHSEPGTEVEIVWGEDPKTSKLLVEEHRQVRIRATVAPSPFTSFARTSYRDNANA